MTGPGSSSSRPAARRRSARAHALLAGLALFAAGGGCTCGSRLQSVTGEGAVSPASLDFGTVSLGLTARQTFALQNVGSEQLTVTQAGFTGANPGDFALPRPLAGQVLEPGDTLTVAVLFAPLDGALRQATLQLTTDSTTKPLLQVGLKGTGIDIHLCPAAAAIDFGPVQVKGTPVTRPLVIVNCGKSPTELSLGALEGAQARDFSLTGPTTATLQPGDSFSITASYAPAAAGPSAADAPYRACPTCNLSPAIALSGSGIDGALAFAPSPVAFAASVAGQAATATVAATNTGTAAISLTALKLRGTQGPFSITAPPALPAALAPGQSLSLALQFTSAAAGDFADDLDATFAAADPAVAPRAASDHLTATANPVPCALQIAPAALAFGGVPLGATASKQVTLGNGGGVACSVTAIALGAGSNAAFALTAPAPATLSVPPRGSAAISVDFRPTVAGGAAPTGTLVFQSSDPAHATSSIPLTASAVTCALQIAPAALAFGTVPLGTTASRSVTLTNGGGAACSVTAIALGAGTNASFTLGPPVQTSLSIPPNGSASIPVSFNAAATAGAPLAGTLVFQTTDPAHATSSIPLSASVIATAYSAGWPKWHFDNFNTGQSPADTTHLSGTVAWKFNVGTPRGGTYLQSPVVDAKGTVYFENMSGTLWAITPAGSKGWSLGLSDPSSDPHPSTPVVLADGSLFVVSGEEQATAPDMYLVSAAGAVTFSKTFGIEGFSATPGFGNDGTLFEADDDGIPGNGNPDDPADAIAFNVSGGKIVQSKGAQIPFSVGISSGERLSVVINADDTSYWTTGVAIAALKPPAQGFGPLAGWRSAPVGFIPEPSGADDLVSDLAMDPRPGGYLFAYAGWVSYGIDTVVAGALVAIDPATGAKKWQANLPPAALPSDWLGSDADYGNASPAVAGDGTVYVGNSDGMRAFDGHTGAPKWFHPTANVTDAAAIGADGTIFFGTQDGTFWALHPDGSLRFSIKTGGQIASAPAIASDGSVYFVSDDGLLYAVR